MAEQVTLTIDDVSVTVPAGTLVVDAAKAAGIEIPIFCSHAKLDPLGACRMCIVEFPGPRGSRLDTACTVRVSEGMAVRTDTEQVRAIREANLGFILLNHPLDCPICDKGGECPLQDQTVEYGPGVSKFVEPKRRKQKHYPISDLIMLDQERCILCWRCIRYLEEWEDKPQLGLFERGGETIIDVFPGRPVDAATSGSIIDICPVGALTNRVARFRYRPWEVRKTPSICTHCPVGCNLRMDERAHSLRRIVARENMAVNDEWICDKGRFLHQHVDHAERLKAPLVRDDGTLRPASWDEALARAAAGLEAVVEAHGPGAVGGIASARVSNEGAYLFQKFLRTLVGTNNVDFPDGSAVRAMPAGIPSIADIARSDLLVLVGIDPSEAAPLLDLRIKRAVRRAGVRLLIIHPRRIELARYVGDARVKGTIYLPVRPGQEAAVLARLTAAVRQAGEVKAQPAGAKRAEQRGRTDPAVDLLLGANASLFIYGPEAARGGAGQAAVAALMALAAAAGQGDRVAYVGTEANSQGARDAGMVSDALPGHAPVGDAAVRERLGKLWGVEPPATPGLSYHQMAHEGAARALMVMGANPAAVPGAAERLSRLDFLVVQDLFLTETAQLADVVLPSASWAEADGTYTNLERRVQRAPEAIRPAGVSRPDWAIIAGLAACWLADCGQQAGPAEADWRRKKKKARSGPVARPWNYPDAATVLDELAKAFPAYAGTRWGTLGEQGQQWPASALPRLVRPVQTPGPSPAASAPLGLSLASGPLLWDAGGFMPYAAEQVRNLIPSPFVALNASDIAGSGLAPGARCRVRSGGVEIVLTLVEDPAVQPGTAWIPFNLAGSPAEALGAGRGEPITVTVEAE
jgi:NADH-quinone oxidoreductase chain G